MHYHCEMVMPPDLDVNETVAAVLEPFNENGDDEEGYYKKHSFWDWWVIGGRWAGCKLMHGLDKEKVDEFHEELKRRHVTVSGITCGKQTLNPASQVPMVDALWNEFFPQYEGNACPMFDHCTKDGEHLAGDIMPLKKVPDTLECSRFIICGPNWNDKMAATFMLCESFWNGVNFEPSKWDGTLGDAIKFARSDFEKYKPEHAEKITPKDNWNVVTVDYHS